MELLKKDRVHSSHSMRRTLLHLIRKIKKRTLMGLQPAHREERDHILMARSKRLEVTITESLININKEAKQVQNRRKILKQ